MTGIRNFRRTLTISMVVCAALGIWTPAVSAGETDTFGVTPHPEHVNGEPRRTIELAAPGGKPIQEAVRVYNRTDHPISVEVYAAEAVTGPDGVVSIGFKGQRREGLASRMRLPERTLQLEERGSEIVTFEVEQWRGAPPAGMAAVVVESKGAAAGQGLDLVQRVAILVRTDGSAAPGPDGGSSADAALRWAAIVASILALGALGLRMWGSRRKRPDAPAETPRGDIGAEIPSEVPGAGTAEAPEPSGPVSMDAAVPSTSEPRQEGSVATAPAPVRAPRKPAAPRARTPRKLNFIPFDPDA